MAQKTTLKEFESVYPKLEEAILEHARSYKLPQAELDWLRSVSKAFCFWPMDCQTWPRLPPPPKCQNVMDILYKEEKKTKKKKKLKTHQLA